GATATAAGADAVVPPPQGVLADWQGHMRAQRIRVYQRPCANVGFGSCDVGFSTIFLTYGFDRFPLYKSPTLDAWYLDPDQASLTH
ncbi:MAG TPA: hypothetical protein VFG43_02555, partial [Geminicoccaceae bacterium]|nr:hypothetical protein [Geminicoccaceae bacterium]